jgi:hypothetical protein
MAADLVVSVVVEADPYAEQFYVRQGFETVGKRQNYPAGRLLPLMKMILPPNE